MEKRNEEGEEVVVVRKEEEVEQEAPQAPSQIITTR
jgi:hypothetical protein